MRHSIAHSKEAVGGVQPQGPAQSQAGSSKQPCQDWMKNKKLLGTGQLARQLPLLHPVHLTSLFAPAFREFH